MQLSDRHGPAELYVFREFALQCPFPLLSERAQKLSPPAPDIRCPLRDGSFIDFELVDGTWPETKKLLNQSLNFDPELRDAFNQAVARRLVKPLRDWSGLSVMVDFCDGATQRARKTAIPQIIKYLGDCGPTPRREYCRDIPSVRLIHIHRNSYADWEAQGPSIRTQNAHSYASAVVDRLKEKVPKTYETTCPLHLLVHCDHDAPLWSWETAATEFLATALAASQFKVVWVYDRSEKAVTFRYPACQ